jgi:hypothetical protein
MAALTSYRWPWGDEVARLLWLKATTAVAGGAADVVMPSPDRSGATVVAAALKHPFFCALGGQEGKPWSCSSLLAATVARFLGGSLPSAKRHVVPVPIMTVFAVTPDGRHIITAKPGHEATYGLRVFRSSDGAPVSSFSIDVLSRGVEDPLKPFYISSLTVGPDGRIYAVDSANGVIHVLSAELALLARVRDVGGDQRGTAGRYAMYANVIQCAVSAKYLATTGFWSHGAAAGVVVYKATDKTTDGFGRHSKIPFGTRAPTGLCFLPGGDTLATLHQGERAVRIMAIRKARAVTVRTLRFEGVRALAIACSSFGELLLSTTSVDGRSRTLHVLCDNSDGDGDTGLTLLCRVPETSAEYTMVALPDGSVAVPSGAVGAAYDAVTLFRAR